MVAEQLLARDIAPVALPGAVIGTVVLTDDAGDGVQEVGVPEQVPIEVEDSAVAQRRWKAGIEYPDELGAGSPAATD